MRFRDLLLTLCLLVLNLSNVLGQEQNQTIQLLANQLHVLPVDGLRRVAVGDPKIADVTVVSEKELMVVAKGEGGTSLIIWDGRGKHAYNIVVHDDDREELAQKLRELLVASDLNNLRVKLEAGKIFIVGEVMSQAQVEQTKNIVQPFKDVAVTLVTVKQRQPLVEIDVNVLEISMDDLKQLGMDWSNSLPITYSESSYIDGKLPKVWRMFKWNRTAVDARLNLLIQEDKARTLANPKLIALSGKEAEFLVGGEVPYVVEKKDFQTTVEWREYGVNLKIKPQVNDHNEIQTEILAEVSDVDWGNAVSHEGFSIPAFKKRKVRTELLLNEGDLAFFAGLIKNEDSRNVDRVPWLGQVPILGQLFKSTDFRDKRTELVITLSPRISGNRPDSEYLSAQMREEEAILAAQRTFSVYSEEGSPLTYYSHMIEDIIARNVKYPQQAYQDKKEGIVKIDLSLFSDGRLKDVQVRESSGYDELDQAALAAVAAQAPYPSFPAQLSQQELRLSIPVVFKSNK